MTFNILNIETGLVLGNFVADSAAEAIEMFCSTWWGDGSFDELAEQKSWDYYQFKAWFMMNKATEEAE